MYCFCAGDDIPYVNENKDNNEDEILSLEEDKCEHLLSVTYYAGQ